MIKSIIFDLGGVYFTDGTSIAIKKISKRYNLGIKEVQEVLKLSSELRLSYRKGEISFSEFWDKAKSMLEIDAENSSLNNLWIRSYKPIGGTVKIIKKLKGRGIKLYYLSDNVKERVECLQKKFGFLENFIGGIFSHEAHKTKKEGTAIFKMAIEKAQNRPEEVIFIDDNEEYAENARKAGMHAICFKNPMQLKQELSNYGVNTQIL